MTLRILYFFQSFFYDTIIDRLFAFDRKKATEQIPKNSNVLEIGVGTGLNLPYYPICTVTGIDQSAAMLNKAKSKHTKATFTGLQANAHNLPFPDNTFDHVVATFALRVIPQPFQALKEVSRVLKKNGTLLVIDQFWQQNSWLTNSITPFLGWGKDYQQQTLFANWTVHKQETIKGATLLILTEKPQKR